MTNNPSENILDEFTETSKIGPPMESSNAVFFTIFCQNYQKFYFELLARNSPLIGDIL